MKQSTFVGEPETVSGSVGYSAAPELPSRPHGGETVLVVVREPVTRQFIVTVLRALGYGVFESVDVPEAVRFLKRRRGEPVDLVVTNLATPVTAGRLLPDQLRKVFSNHRMLYCADVSESLTWQSWRSNDRVPLLQKPFTAKQLADKVRLIIDQPQPVVAPRRAVRFAPFWS